MARATLRDFSQKAEEIKSYCVGVLPPPHPKIVSQAGVELAQKIGQGIKSIPQAEALYRANKMRGDYWHKILKERSGNHSSSDPIQESDN